MRTPTLSGTLRDWSKLQTTMGAWSSLQSSIQNTRITCVLIVAVMSGLCAHVNHVVEVLRFVIVILSIAVHTLNPTHFAYMSVISVTCTLLLVGIDHKLRYSNQGCVILALSLGIASLCSSVDFMTSEVDFEARFCCLGVHSLKRCNVMNTREACSDEVTLLVLL